MYYIVLIPPRYDTNIMTIEARTKLLTEEFFLSQKDIEDLSGISQQVWSKIFNGKQRMTSQHLDFIYSKYPEYIDWLISGKTDKGSFVSKSREFEFFTSKAKKYAKTMALYEFAVMVEEYILSRGSEETEIDCPLQSDLERIENDYFNHLIFKEFKLYEKWRLKKKSGDYRKLIEQHFNQLNHNTYSKLTRERDEENGITDILMELN